MSERTEALKKILATKGVVGTLEDSIKKGVAIDSSAVAKVFENNKDFGLVRVTCSRPSCVVNFGKITDLNNIKSKVDPAQLEALKSASNSLTITAFPEMVKQVTSIYTSCWTKVNTLCSCGSSLMSKKTFINEFLPFLQKKQEKLEEVLAQIEANWTYEMGDTETGEKGRFELLVEEALKGVPSELECYVRAEVKRLTSTPCSSFLSVFKISLITEFSETDFETADEKLKELLKEFKENALINSGNEIIKGLLQEVWEASMSYVGSLENPKNDLSDDITVASFRGRNTFRGRVAKINEEIEAIEGAGIVSPYIEIIKSLITDASMSNSKFDAEECLLQALALIKKEAEKTDISLPYKKEDYISWIDSEKLDEVYEEFIEGFAS